MARAQANKKYHYVLVFTDNGAVYVTGIEPDKVAHWTRTEAPKAFCESDADYISVGLLWHGITAVHVVLPYELENQPYNYEHGQFVWKWNEGEDEDESEEETA